MAFVTPVVEHWLEREITQWVHPMKDRSDDPSHHERMLLQRSYISLRWNIKKLTNILQTQWYPQHENIINLFKKKKLLFKRNYIDSILKNASFRVVVVILNFLK